MISPMSGDKFMLADKFVQDKMPAIVSQADVALLDNDWVFGESFPGQSQPQVMMQWILDTWHDTSRKPKFGHVGAPYEITNLYQDGIDYELAAHPGEFDWVGVEKAPVSTTAWAAEIGRFKECDYIILTLVGPGMTSFVKEARERGYKGAFLSGQEAFPGFWPLVTDTVAPDQLYECYHVGYWPWYNETGSFVAQTKELIQRYHPGDADFLLSVSGPLSGHGLGLLMVDAVERAVAQVGAENVDGTALRDALAATDMTLEGLGNTWKLTGGRNFFATTQRMYKWDIASQDWQAISDWYPLPAFE